MLINFNHRLYTGCLLCTALLIVLCNQSCKKSDTFYEDLETILQMAGDQYSYRSSYQVGDTIYFYGRFGAIDSDLSIRIGDADGQLANRSYVEAVRNNLGDVAHDKRLQLVKVPVEEAMGAGPGRRVLFTLGEQTLEGAPIYIRNAGAAAVFSDTLNLTVTGFDFENNKRFFIRSWNGTGNVFYFNYENNSLNVWKENVSTHIPVSFTDEVDQFTITIVNSAHVDRTEKHLYFCASTKNVSTGATVQRFCKISLVTNQLTTLNITAGSISSGPWEGAVADVKLPVMRLLYTAEDGRVYFVTGRTSRNYLTGAIGKIDPAGNVTYPTGSLSGTTINNPPITFSNPGGGSTTPVAPVSLAIDADRNLLYHLAYVDTYNPRLHQILSVYDFDQQREVNSFVPEHADFNVEMVLNAPFEAAKFDQGGTWFLQQDKPVFFLGSYNDQARNDWNAAVVIDFKKRETFTYAPRFTFQHGTTVIDRPVLNYTPEGHVIFMRQYDRYEEPDNYPLYTLEITEIKK